MGMAKVDTEKVRKELVREFDMTEDEETFCWSLLNEFQLYSATPGHPNCGELKKQIRRRVSWLRTESGQAWVKAQAVIFD